VELSRFSSRRFDDIRQYLTLVAAISLPISDPRGHFNIRDNACAIFVSISFVDYFGFVFWSACP
jgi:hypothetical protein